MKLVEQRTCPICGDASHWRWGLLRHLVGADKYTHVRLRVDRGGKEGVVCMVSILKNGKALTAGV